MRLRIVGLDGNRSVFVDIDECKPFSDALPVIEEAIGNTSIFEAYDLYPSAYVDENRQKIRCVMNEPVRAEVLPRDLDLCTRTLVLREKNVHSAPETELLYHGWSTSTLSDGPPPSYRERLWAIYATYEPGKLRFVDGTLQKYKGREEAVIKALTQKYGPEPDFDKVKENNFLVEPPKSDILLSPATLFSPVSGQSTTTPTINDLDLLFAPASPSPSTQKMVRREKSECLWRALSHWADHQTHQQANQRRGHYFFKWLEYRDQRVSERVLEQQIWKRSVSGFQLVDNTTPPLEVADLVDYVRFQRLAKHGLFSDSLQIALRELIATVSHSPNPLESTGARSASSMPQNGFSALHYSSEDYNPVKDTEKTASAVQHSARQLQYFYRRDAAEEQEYIKKYKRLENAYETLKAENSKLSSSCGIAASVPSDSPAIIEKVNALEEEASGLRTKLREAKEQHKKDLADVEMQCEDKNRRILKLQHELAKVRTLANKHKEEEEKLTEKLEKILEEETKSRERQKNRESVKTRTLSASDRARSGSIRHGMFSDPLSLTAVAQRASLNSGKTSRARIDIHTDKPMVKVPRETSVIDRGRSTIGEENLCPLCQSPLALCSTKYEDADKRAAFCFSCRRSFTHADLLARE